MTPRAILSKCVFMPIFSTKPLKSPKMSALAMPSNPKYIKKQINTGETLHFYFDEKVLSQVSPEAKLIDDCGHYSVWFKPNGMLSQGSKWSDHCTITRWAQTHLPGDRACFLVHRLDRATSGIILVAHTKSATKAFGKLFERHDLTKCYQAIQKIMATPVN